MTQKFRRDIVRCIGWLVSHWRDSCKSAIILSRLTENDAGSVNIPPAVVRIAEQKIAGKCVVQRKKVSSKVQEKVRTKRSKQVKNQRDVVKPTAKGEQKMNDKNWMNKVVNFAADLAVKATFVASLNAGMSVAP